MLSLLNNEKLQNKFHSIMKVMLLIMKISIKI
jgi:hypothetical protein